LSVDNGFTPVRFTPKQATAAELRDGVEEADGRRCEPGPMWLPPRWLSLADVFEIYRPMNNAPHWNTVSVKSAAAVTPCEPKSCEVQFWLIRFDFGFHRLIRLWEKCNKN